MTSVRPALVWAWKNAEKLLALAALVAALFALNLARVQLVQANQVAWDYSGGAQCSDYRGQVLELWKLGLNQDQIRQWFSAEAGGAQNQFGPTSENNLAIDDFEDNCGSIALLVSYLPANAPPS